MTTDSVLHASSFPARSPSLGRPVRLTLVIPCYNEEKTLERCVQRVLGIQDDELALEVIVVDDRSDDDSPAIALALAERMPEVTVIRHDRNMGKGAALRTGFQKATGDFVAVQDADLEYDPGDLKKLLVPLVNDEADIVLGSRFLTSGPHRVLYFWHSLGNKFLTLLSNMFSDLNLTDMETCYKVFKREFIQSITVEENRFGVEPELVAKMAAKRVRIFEMGISYYGRTYEEGKKIKAKDGLRALYCIFHYNAPTAPLPIQFLIYLLIGGLSALFNLFMFLGILALGWTAPISAAIAYVTAAALNYLLCIALLFRHKAKWNSLVELLVYILLVLVVGVLDVGVTHVLLLTGMAPWLSKSTASVVGLILNFLGRKYFVFPQASAGAWKSKPARS
jgi:dolichol-phosphate mannosyltransferase